MGVVGFAVISKLVERRTTDTGNGRVLNVGNGNVKHVGLGIPVTVCNSIGNRGYTHREGVSGHRCRRTDRNGKGCRGGAVINECRGRVIHRRTA